MNLLLPWWWRWAAGGILMLAVAAGAAWKMRQWDNARYDKLQEEYSRFKADVTAAGEAAKAKADATAKENAQRKELADATIKTQKYRLDVMYAEYQRLRDSRSGGSYLPAASPGAADPSRACFDRATIDRKLGEADRILQEGAVGLLRRGDQAIADLDALRSWAAAGGCGKN